MAAGRGSLDIVEAFLAAGANVNVRAIDGQSRRTALQVAAELGHVDVVKILLQHGADVEASTDLPSPFNVTALTLAKLNKHSRCVNLLLKHGAKVQDTRLLEYLL